VSGPLISIVVPSFNQGRFIEQTLASVAGQCWPRLELIVVDGGSTDETREVVERYRHVVTHFISEPDRGQADAINKGFRLAEGDILAWLNSDDFYLPCTLQKIALALGDWRAPALATGGVLCMFEGKAQAQAFLPFSFDPAAMRTRDRMFQAATFWTRGLWEKTGELNPDYHYVLDWDWFLRASAHCGFTPVEDFLSVYRFHAGHKSSRGDDRRTREILDFIERNAPPEWSAAYRDVVENLEALKAARAHPSLLNRRRTHALYRKHGDRVKVALAQLGV
jgi:glycosyltransferase involved in cell wall biosynthesis